MTLSDAYPCPICRKLVVSTAKFFPFCSDRCRMMDLGKWLSEDYRVIRPLRSVKGTVDSPEDVEDEAPAAPGDRDDE